MVGATIRNGLVSLSKATRSGRFVFLGSGFARILKKDVKQTNMVASRQFEKKNASLPVDVHRSKTPLLKLSVGSLRNHVGKGNDNATNQ